jgi:mRNA-degrading endonuclease RelE of RelBE toxin-antitoxin system
MDKIQKALKRLTEKERGRFKALLVQIERGDLKGLDIKKLKDREDIYRVRKGDMRVIFRKHKNAIYILALERRTSTTYK